MPYAVNSRYAPNAGDCCAPGCTNAAHYRVADEHVEYLVCPKHEIPYLHGLQTKRYLTDIYQPPNKET